MAACHPLLSAVLRRRSPPAAEFLSMNYQWTELLARTADGTDKERRTSGVRSPSSTPHRAPSEFGVWTLKRVYLHRRSCAELMGAALVLAPTAFLCLACVSGAATTRARRRPRAAGSCRCGAGRRGHLADPRCGSPGRRLTDSDRQRLPKTPNGDLRNKEMFFFHLLIRLLMLGYRFVWAVALGCQAVPQRLELYELKVREEMPMSLSIL